MTPVRRFVRRFRGDERGTAVVEFALVLPLLLLLVFMLIDATRAFYTLNSLVSAAREGARYASAQDLDCPTPSLIQQAAVKDKVVNAAVLLGGTQLTASYIQVTLGVAGGGAATCENVEVRIENYPFRPATPLANIVGADSILMTRAAVFRWERAP
jgi:Flp pilus assembly protein TadG